MNQRKSHSFSIYSLIIALCIMVLSSAGYAQAQEKTTVKGTVVDAVGNPIPGATIIIIGSSSGTVTDFEGNFSLDCSTSDSLSISFIGFSSVTSGVQAGQALNITLVEDIATLNEVVVVGYGTMRKSDLTGSITSVKAEDLHKGVVTTTEQVLQGKVAGLTVVKGSGDPTQGATMRLRGGTSLIASSTPLVVVDGIPGVDINTIQPSDIQSIDVLKDASAAAIYGSRGANGVIIITTTRPEKGSKIEYSNYVAFGKVSNSLDLLSASEWRSKVEELNAKKAIDFEGDTDWQKEITQNSISQNHNLSFSNANDGGGYRGSVSYLKNEGVIKTSQLERLGASVSAFTYGLNDKLRLDFGTHTTFDKYNPIDNAIFERAYNLNPTAPVYDENGEYFQVDGTNTENPVEILMNRNDDQTKKRLLGYAKAELEIISGLKAVINTSYEYNSRQGRFYLPTYKFKSTDNGYASRALNDYTTLQLETYLTYDKELNGGHRLNFMGGYSYLDNTYEGFNAERRSFDTDMFLYNNLQAGLDYRATDVGSYKGNSKLVSFFGRVNYSYNGRYIFTGTLRRDGSTRFGENNKWGVFPSAALAWRVSDESFMAGTTSWLNHLKLRTGWGITGSQDAIGEYKTIGMLGADSNKKFYDPATKTWKASYSPIQNANPDLKWETTTQTNLGIDFTIINKISGSIDLYSKMTSDLIFEYSVPQPPNLYNTTLANVGDLSNKGIELALNYTAIQTSDWRWDLNLSLAKNTMKIEKLSNETFGTEPIPSGSLHGLRGMSNQYSQTIREGYAVGTFWGQECIGVDENGQFLNVNGDPLVVDSKNDSLNTDLGNAQPKLSLGFSTAVTYKNWDLSVTTYGLFGQKVLNATEMSMTDPARFPTQNVFTHYFADSITSSPTYSSYWVKDASFFRLQSLTLGYTFKFKNKGVDRIRVYATGENLFVITKYEGLDPEIKLEEYDAARGTMSGLLNPGIDRYDVYPKTRTISFGLSVTF